MRQTCPIPAGAAPIGCFKLVFPFNISLYDANSQTPQMLTMQDDYDLLAFVVNLGAGQYFQINYPLQATLNNAPITINSNAELSSQIYNAIENCGCDNPHVLTDQLAAYIPFAGEVNDLTGFAVPSVLGSTHYVTDRSGNLNGAISFDTNDGTSRIEIPLTGLNAIPPGVPFSISLWFKRQDTNPAGTFEDLFTGEGFALNLGNNNLPSQRGPVIIYHDNPTLYDFSWVSQNLGTDTSNWHHVVITYNGETAMTLYRDGSYVNQMGANEISILGMIIGGNYKGYLDDLRVYKKALEMEEIQILYELEGDTSHCLD
ncbi:LamG domain-containing protein [Flavobacterium sp.]|uniref:LamG domain-containing protein n=1 Tax=Flavobacterium sp. TaxID=239 RepID=UPI0039E2906B